MSNIKVSTDIHEFLTKPSAAEAISTLIESLPAVTTNSNALAAEPPEIVYE